MSHATPFRSLERVVVTLIGLLALFALACSGGGGSGDSATTGGTGSTSVFLTDAPSDDFDEILVTISALELHGNGRPIVIFKGRETVDLKDLENFSDLFVYAEKVPVGAYNKIRMFVEKIELVDEGEVIEARPPANGKIDLLPRGPFSIRKDVTTVIEIDMDAKKSIHIAGPRYNFRPVVFVTIRETESPSKLARVHGEVTELLTDGGFELCSTIFMAARTNSSEPGDDEGGIGDRHRCMSVEKDDATGVFDENGDPTNVASIEVGDEVTVVGRFHLVDANHDDMMDEQPTDVFSTSRSNGHARHHESFASFLADRRNGGSDDDTDDDSDDDSDRDSDRDTDRDTDSESDTDGGGRPNPPDVDIVFLAYVVEIGPPGTFMHLKGLIVSDLDDMDEFDFAIDPGQGFGDMSVVKALLQDGTRIFTRTGRELTEEEIVPDTIAKIDGIFASDAFGTFYKTALLILDLQIDEAMKLSGEVVTADEALRTMLLSLDAQSGGGEECVDVPVETGIYLIHADVEGGISEEGDFSDLTPGLRSDVYGMFEEVDGCFVAKTIIAFPIDCDDSISCPFGQYCAKDDGACEETGRCQTAPNACTLNIDEVCGCDGVTYDNECEAHAAGASVASAGACEGGIVTCGGAEDVACPDGSVCVIEAGMCEGSPEGVCEITSGDCPSILDRVCGCDGENYDNACLATRAGVVVASPGACEVAPVRCGGLAGTICESGRVCLIEEGVCDPSATGECIEDPGDCMAAPEEPVCGCDGLSYRNRCEATVAGITVESEGACESVEP